MLLIFDAKKNIYVIGFLVGVIVQVIYLLVSHRIFIETPILVSILIIGSRFLSGLGFYSTYSLAVLLLLKTLSPLLKKKKRASKFCNIFLNFFGIILFLILLISAILSMISNQAIEFFSIIIGLIIVALSFYIIPIWREDITFKPEPTFIRKLEEIIGRTYMKIKKGYYRYFTGEYLKAYSIEYLVFKAKLDEIRYKTAYLLLPIIAISAIIFPLLFVLVCTITLNLLIKKKDLEFLDKVVIICSLIFLLCFTLYLIYIKATIPFLVLAWHLPYIVGLSISFLLYVKASLIK